jgi:hypothetical protein
MDESPPPRPPATRARTRTRPARTGTDTGTRTNGGNPSMGDETNRNNLRRRTGI